MDGNQVRLSKEIATYLASFPSSECKEMKLDQNYNEIEKFEVNSTSFPGHESVRKQDGTY